MRIYSVSTRFHLYSRVLLPLWLLATCTHCGPAISEEHRQTATQLPVDTVEVTSAHVERENSPELANWAVFEAGREIICVPPGWTSHLKCVDSGRVTFADAPSRTKRPRMASD